MLITRLDHPSEERLRQVESFLHATTQVKHIIPGAGGTLTFLCTLENGEGPALVRQLQQEYRANLATVVDTPYLLSSRAAALTRTVVPLAGRLSLGAEEFVVMAGPCTVESREQTLTIAQQVQQSGAQVLRGGAFKPRTSPFSFQGLREAGLKILQEARQQTGLAIVSEVLSERDVPLVAETVDILQVGMRNALNYALLKDLGQLPGSKPVLLKCGIGTRLDEFLCAADYILAEGNPNVILCLRGSTGLFQGTRASLNISDIAVLRERTHLPIVVDPSHVSGKWEYVPAIAASALVAGADGLLVEVHHRPEEALADGRQSLLPRRFARLMHRLRHIAPAVGRRLKVDSSQAAGESDHPMSDLCLEAPAAESGSTPWCSASTQASSARAPASSARAPAAPTSSAADPRRL